MEKIKEYKGIIIITLILILGIFYWFQIRPTNIKKDCSWTKEVLPADVGVTKEQAEVNKRIYDKCIASNWECTLPSGLGRVGLWRDSTERPPQPEREEISEATKNEYDSCLRKHGI